MVSLTYQSTLPISILSQSMLATKHGMVQLGNKEQARPQSQKKKRTQRRLVDENTEVPTLLMGFLTNLV